MEHATACMIGQVRTIIIVIGGTENFGQVMDGIMVYCHVVIFTY